MLTAIIKEKKGTDQGLTPEKVDIGTYAIDKTRSVFAICAEMSNAGGRKA